MRCNLNGATPWCLWIECNNPTFNNIEQFVTRMWEKIIYLVVSNWSSKCKLFSKYDVASIALNWKDFLLLLPLEKFSCPYSFVCNEPYYEIYNQRKKKKKNVNNRKIDLEIYKVYSC